MNDLRAVVRNLSAEKRDLLWRRLAVSSNKVRGSQPSIAIAARPQSGLLPLSYPQQRLWFLHQLDPSSVAYNVPVAARIRGPLNVEALEWSLSEIVRRHEALRTVFSLVDGKSVQIVEPPAAVRLSVRDARGLPDAEITPLIDGFCAAEARRAFDLTKDAMLRGSLLRVADEDHVLLLTVHHVASDGWSMGVLLHELTALYEAFEQGQPSPLPDLAVQYADYALWQQQRVRSGELQTQLAYWKRKLSGASPSLALPTTYPRPEVQTLNGAIASTTFPPDLTASLKDFSQSRGVTLFMTLLAALNVLLHRYSGQDDILVGSPLANRNRPEIENLIGFFVNTLVFRTDLSGDPPFEELLARVQQTTTEGYAHQDLPFEKLVEELRPDRDLSRPPVFQVMLALQNTPRPPLELSGLTLELLDVDCGAARFDVTFFMEDTPRGLVTKAEYNTDLFGSATITGMLEHLRAVLDGVLRRPDDRVSRLPLMTPSERHRLLVDWNDARATYPSDDGLHRIVERQVERSPKTVAVVHGNERLTFQDLNARANRLARYLRTLGVGPEVLVGVCLGRSADMVVSLLAVLKAGGAYVPLDPAYPEQRLAFILNDSRASVVITEQSILGALPAHQAQVLCLDLELDSIASQSAENLTAQPAPQNLAYLIYTSGSTGTPKAVAIEHRSAAAFVHWAGTVFSDEELAGVLASTSICFDLSIFEIFVTLSWGGKVILADNALHLTAIESAREVTLINTVPSAMAELVRAGAVPAGVRTVNLAGEPIPSELVRQIYSLGTVTRLLNLYGPSEDTTYSTFIPLDRSATRTPPIGRPIAGTQIYILDRHGDPVPQGVSGEIYIGGEGLARGYLGRPDLTADRFVPDPFCGRPGARLYRTGDLARYLADRNIDFLGRIDHQVKIRGFRIELGEIETALDQHPDVESSVAVLREDVPGDKRLAAYVVSRPGSALTPGELRHSLKMRLPEFMVPSAVVVLEAMPLTPNGKIDRARLPAPDPQHNEAVVDYVEPKGDIERTISTIWREVLRVERVGANDNFFDLGGHSLLLSQVYSTLVKTLGREIKLLDLFKFPTVGALARHLAQPGEATGASGARGHRGRARRDSFKRTDFNVAVIGMACRFPGARNVRQFWRNLCGGVESISFFSDEQLAAAGIEEPFLQNPNYVKARGVIEDVDQFDASFFGFSPREAEITDPQQRLFLECAWDALEDAGCDPTRFEGAIGVYAGSGMNSYVLNLIQNRDVVNAVGPFQTMIANDKDFLAPRVSYKLGLIGPSVSVQTACSTSLVAAHMACQSLLLGECDVALAGGVSIRIPQESGYIHQQGSIFSPDGHCRAFDAEARGMVGGNGAGIVVLKRLADAVADGDQVYAVIKGSAINNDGSLKVGFTAPSVSGQAKVIAEALYVANVDPATIGYVETHGTGTELGDPIEIAALTQAFGGRTGVAPTCAIGSVKTNVGHLDSAAGVAGLIKAALALHHKKIPPSLHFKTPNPKCDFENSPFFVNTELRDWDESRHPRRAGVSSLGIGGTNAHVVLEEAPAFERREDARPLQLLTLSAKSEAALVDASLDLAAHLGSDPNADLADVAFTLHVGRKEFEFREILVCSDRDDARRVLDELDTRRLFSGTSSEAPSVAFLFTGQGAQHAGMGWDLYRSERLFREQVDYCAGRLKPRLGLDLRTLLYPDSDEDRKRSSEQLRQTLYAQPALFTIEYALARLWMDWGIRPRAMIGHSLGEYVAACIAGVFSLDDAVQLVAARGALMQSAPPGAMLSLSMCERDLGSLVPPGLSIAAVNSPTHCVVSGPKDRVDSFRERLVHRSVGCSTLHVSHAFHSDMMDSILEPFVAAASEIRMRPPSIPFVSNLTGNWIQPKEAADPAYWARHLRSTVRFADGLRKLLDAPGVLLVEVGPGNTLAALAKEQTKGSSHTTVLSSMRHPLDQRSDVEYLLTTLGRLWVAGVPIDWSAFHRGEKRRRTSLPAYPFQRQRYWIQPPAAPAGTAVSLDQQSSGRERHARPTLRSAYVAPRSAAERFIAEICENLLGIDRVGVEDNFFDLGGHSLLATQLVSRVRERFGIEIPLRSVFDFPTTAGLAQLIQPGVEETAENDPLASLLSEIEGLSAEEVAAAIAEEEEIHQGAGND
ncbi:MAG: amino acid adenylation domain-containing protein [Acidobacteriota bacterium]